MFYEKETDFAPHTRFQRWMNYIKILAGEKSSMGDPSVAKLGFGVFGFTTIIGVVAFFTAAAVAAPLAFAIGGMFTGALNWAYAHEIRDYRRQHHPKYADPALRAVLSDTPIGLLENGIVGWAPVIMGGPAAFLSLFLSPFFPVFPLIFAGFGVGAVGIGVLKYLRDKKDAATLNEAHQQVAMGKTRIAKSRPSRQRLKIKDKTTPTLQQVEATAPGGLVTKAQGGPILRRPEQRTP